MMYTSSSSTQPAALTENADQLLLSEYDVIIHQQDKNSPLYSVSSFEDLQLSDELLQGVYNMKFTKPSKIQASALPLLLRDPPENLIAQSQSGTGKTAAFSLAILSRVQASDPATQAMVVAPTRELARQIVEVMKELGRFSPVTVTEVIPGGGVYDRKIGGHIVVGTPGTMLRLIQSKALGVARLRMLALDEADIMLDIQSLGAQTMQIKRRVPEATQLIFFSATWAENIVNFARQFMGSGANEIRLQVNELTISNIKQFFIDCNDELDRFEILVDLYGLMTVSQSMIFVHRKDNAEKIAEMMTSRHHHVSFLHGGLDVGERDRRMDDFRAGRSKVLISTNVLARGLDVCNVNLVINYDLPVGGKGLADHDAYLHRIGRTGRFGRRGITINFVHDEPSYEILSQIQTYFGCNIIKLPTQLDSRDGVTADQKAGRSERMEDFLKAAMKG
ncbi:ATP-dependent RNA helicase DDX19/DBP5 [Entomortierella parvispora]|uniref:RNA helicase n=1 Tax=Entomortierella parvispora TaxID=205924 RepID=A0A9P3H120_9FUNG|nr:ATP-dependent RNA helicase DDX19/DBP5 [Entomortierella parvispora]